MSTRSNIAYYYGPDKFKMIYVHSDGYITGAGKTLFNHYKNPKKVEKLIKLGSISILGAEIGKKQSFDNFDYKSNQCLAYGRDRGEKNVEAREYSSVKEMVAHMEEYLYIFYPDTCKWYVICSHYDTSVMVELNAENINTKDEETLFSI